MGEELWRNKLERTLNKWYVEIEKARVHYAIVQYIQRHREAHQAK
jgi:hypothetical protein